MKAQIHVQRSMLFDCGVYVSCKSVCNVCLEDVDQVMNIPLSVKNIRKILLSMGYDQIEVTAKKINSSMDNFQHQAKLKEVKERRDFIEANPDLDSEKLALKFRVSVSTIHKDKKHVANRQEFKYDENIE